MNLKDYKNFGLEDFLADEEFRLWVFKKEDGLDYFWKKWMLSHPDKKETVLKARELLISMKFNTAEIETDKDKTLDLILKGERSNRYVYDNDFGKVKVMRPDKQNKTRLWMKIAASIILICAFSFFLITVRDNVIEEEIAASKVINDVVKENPKGQKLTFMLPDGSKVILNAESKIVFPETFGETSRNVLLEGEAYFEVVKDKSRPFTVQTDKTSTEVLGTSFNVEAFPETNKVAVSLLEGKVKVTANGVTGNTNEFLLEPGEKISIDSESSSALKTRFDVLEDFGWKDGILVFRGDSFRTVKEKLERWYGIEIEMENSPEEMEIKGRFDNLSLEKVLENLRYTNNIDYTIENKTVTIKFKEV